MLTCKSLVRLGYRGERLIEPSSSWFTPKFPSGKLTPKEEFCEVKQMIRGIDVLCHVDLFSNFKCARRPPYFGEGGTRILAFSGPSPVSGTGDAGCSETAHKVAEWGLIQIPQRVLADQDSRAVAMEVGTR